MAGEQSGSPVTVSDLLVCGMTYQKSRSPLQTSMPS